MKCYVHESHDAVAVCKACGRGACRSCARVIGDWIACRPECEQGVATIRDMVGRTNPRMRATHGAQAAVFLVLFLAAAIAGVIAEGVGRGIMLSAAVLLLVASLRFFQLARMYRAPPPGGTPPTTGQGT